MTVRRLSGQIPVLYAAVHEACVRADDHACPTKLGPMTRRQARASARISNGRGGIAKPSRRAWWCHRCKLKVTSKHKVVYVRAS